MNLDRDEIEFGGWRAWFTGRSLIMVIGGVITLAVWKLGTPGWAQVTSALYVAISLAWTVWDGWDLRWAIPIITAVAAYFTLTYFTDGYAAFMAALRDRTSLHTATLIGVIGWAAAASMIALVLWWRSRAHKDCLANPE